MDVRRIYPATARHRERPREDHRVPGAPDAARAQILEALATASRRFRDRRADLRGRALALHPVAALSVESHLKKLAREAAPTRTSSKTGRPLS